MKLYCFKCNTTKKLTEFYKDKTTNTGMCRPCKKCKKQYRIINKNKLNSQKRFYASQNREKIKIRSQKYYKKNRKRILEHCAAYLKNRRKIDPIFRLEDNTKRSINLAYKKLGIIKTNPIFKKLKYKPIDLYNHLQKYINKECEGKFCNKKIVTQKNSEKDHYIPIATAKTEKDIIKLNQLNNLRLICKLCNRLKRDKLI